MKENPLSEQEVKVSESIKMSILFGLGFKFFLDKSNETKDRLLSEELLQIKKKILFVNGLVMVFFIPKVTNFSLIFFYYFFS